MHTRLHTYKHTHTRTHARIHTNTHTHTHTHMQFVSALSLPDEELGMPNKYIEMDPLLTFPFGGKEQEQLKVNRLAQFFQ